MHHPHYPDALRQDTVEDKMCHIGDTSQTRPNLVPFLPQHLVGRQRSEDTFKSQQIIIGLSLPEFEGCVGMDVHQRSRSAASESSRSNASGILGCLSGYDVLHISVAGGDIPAFGDVIAQFSEYPVAHQLLDAVGITHQFTGVLKIARGPLLSIECLM